ncbi:MAG TPA: phosphatidylserine decarboxylase family protein [Clostridia bacterium]|nr:phosphatidylserine decarboxylase family protein [Clostridia bacterium]
MDTPQKRKRFTGYKGYAKFLVPDAIPYLAVLGLLTALAFYGGGWPWGILPALLFLFVCWFFRNPPRTIRAGEGEVVSPADGIVLAVEEVEEENYLHNKAVKVSIFLNVFNVHVNRAPLAGAVDYLVYRPGKFLPAFKSHASTLNERNYVGIKSEENPAWSVLVVQITGFVARRIVCWVKQGEKLGQGEIFGMIKFGSCTELYLPLGFELLVKKGDKVKGGETIIGRFRHE